MFKYRCYWLVEKGKVNPPLFLILSFAIPCAMTFALASLTGWPLHEFAAIPGLICLSVLVLAHETFEEKINNMKKQVKRWVRSE